MGGLDEVVDESFDGGVPFIKEGGEIGRVAIDAKGKLGEVVGADRKSIETGCKVISEEDIGGDFCHDVDLEVVCPAL